MSVTVNIPEWILFVSACAWHLLLPSLILGLVALVVWFARVQLSHSALSWLVVGYIAALRYAVSRDKDYDRYSVWAYVEVARLIGKRKPGFVNQVRFAMNEINPASESEVAK